MRRHSALTILLLASSLFGARAFAAGYTLLAPPRQNPAQERAVYGGIAQFLTRATGAPIRFHYISNWLTYMAAVHGNAGDIYFDGPALIGWRIAHWHDQVAVALSGHLKFVLVQKADGRPLTRVRDLVGRSVCAFSPPNLATLTLDSRFTNPARQPFIVVIHSLAQAAHNIISGNCMAALEPLSVYRHQSQLFPGRLRAPLKIPGIPNQAFSFNARMPLTLRHKIIAALLSPAGQRATSPLRMMFGDQMLVRVHDAAYLPYRKMLDVMYGF
ncbi:PhnD/SsuA/transferrin family substrate-binding protein [Acidiferrobacter sp.]|uniref:PhnD/SsuA/transferrin family substrate-binding protein n=1 Tax=Acidiferrobacter sp. TaxID=1872107 RepID=UPI0026190AC7|nr:PhnD/SsuA/transferrin family substrate-binding protein [Acidiferrobacter sp.]